MKQNVFLLAKLHVTHKNDQGCDFLYIEVQGRVKEHRNLWISTHLEIRIGIDKEQEGKTYTTEKKDSHLSFICICDGCFAYIV